MDASGSNSGKWDEIDDFRRKAVGERQNAFELYAPLFERRVHKLDLPCNNADSAATAELTAYGTDHAEKLRD